MPTFLENSLSGLNRGWQQLYGGQPAAGPAVTTLYGEPTATPVATPVAVPIARNPEVGQPIGADNSTPASTTGDPLTDYYAALFGLPVIRRMAAADNAIPMSRNPEMGQPLSGNDGSDTSGAGLLSTNPLQAFFQNLTRIFSGGGQSPGQPASTNAPTLDANAQVGPPTPTMPQAPQTTGGVATDSPSIDAANAANTSWDGGGGMSGKQMASSAIGAIGSGISNIGKNIAATKATYTAPNIPLPQRAVFTPPTLAPNRNV